MKYLEQIISDILRQNRKIFSLLVFFLIVSCKKEEKGCDQNSSISIINFRSNRSLEKIKVYKLKNNKIIDSLLFLSSGENKINKNDSAGYFINIKDENYTFLDTIEIIENKRKYLITGMKYGKTKVKTNYTTDYLCEIQEYHVNNELVKDNAIFLNLDDN